MMGAALAARAIAAVAGRDLASEWGGPALAAAPANRASMDEAKRRLVVRKP